MSDETMFAGAVVVAGLAITIKALRAVEALRKYELRHTTPGGVQTRAPLLGEHNDEILAEVLGFAEDEIREIRASGALGEVQTRAAAE